MRRFDIALCGIALFASVGVAADADHDLTMKVKNAIAAQPSLRSINLMVSVQDGVAVLGGAVPTASTGEALAKIVQAVPGISAVRVNCWVPAAEDPLQAAVKAKLNPQPEIAKGTLKTVGFPSVPPALLGPPTLGNSAAYSPVPPPAPPAPPGPPQYPTIPSPRLPVTPSQDVAAAVEAVRKSDRRFNSLTTTVTTGTVVIAGYLRDGSEAWDLAAAVRRVPGVDKVIVGRTTAR